MLGYSILCYLKRNDLDIQCRAISRGMNLILCGAFKKDVIKISTGIQSG